MGDSFSLQPSTEEIEQVANNSKKLNLRDGFGMDLVMVLHQVIMN